MSERDESQIISEPVFGTMLRADRLRWHWWKKRKVFVRGTPLEDRIIIEVARTFAALSKRATDTKALRSVIEDEYALDLCEPLQGEFTRDYHSWEVDEDGKVIA